jgi:hypothetical protein
MNPNAILADILRAHGIESVPEDDDWLAFPDRNMRGFARVFDRDQTWQLDVVLEIWPGWALVESCAGVGASADEAVKDAFDSFMRGSLHVLLAAFFPDATGQDAQIRHETWTIGGTSRSAIIGRPAFRGKVPDAPWAWLSQFETALSASSLSEGTHWIRLYYAQNANKPMSHEVLLDNETWPEMEEAMTHFSWPAQANFYSARVFLVVRGGVGIAEACDAIVRCASADAIDEMIVMGASPRRATLLYSLITLAFGRLLLDGLGAPTSDVFLLYEPDGTCTERALSSEPIYTEALTIAKARRQLGSDQFAAIAMQSSEVNAANKAMNKGVQAKDLMPFPPAILLPA